VASLVDRLADDVLQPLRGETWRTAISPPRAVEGVELSGDGLAATTIKDSEDGEWVVLRCVNLHDAARTGTWSVPGVSDAMRTRLDETELEPVPVQDGRITFAAPPRAIVTILVR
jgi:alpha-mannosidase